MSYWLKNSTDKKLKGTVTDMREIKKLFVIGLFLLRMSAFLPLKATNCTEPAHPLWMLLNLILVFHINSLHWASVH